MIILVLFSTLYIYKNLFIICTGIIPNLLGELSRSEDGNDFIYLCASIVITTLIIIIVFFILGKLLGEYANFTIIIIALYFKFGTDKGVA